MNLVKSKLVNGDLERTIKLEVETGLISVKEVDADESYVTVEADRGDGSSSWITVRANADQLWKLAVGIASLFGGVALTKDEQRARSAALREKLFDVLEKNEARCLDDNIDRDAVLDDLLRALT
jgi:hypothetical protein